MTLQIKGKIEAVLKPESGVSKAGNSWQKQEFVVTTDDQFPKKICFTLFNDKTSLLADVTKNDEVEVSFQVESREFNGKWYHNINAWKIEKITGESQLPESFPEYRPDEIPPEPDDDGDGMPF